MQVNSVVMPKFNTIGPKNQNDQKKSNQIQPQTNNVSFGKSFITLSMANIGKYINNDLIPQRNKSLKSMSEQIAKSANEVIGEINKKTGKLITGENTKTIQKHKDLQNKVDFFMLGAGEGSRFRRMAETITGRTYQLENGAENKITMPFPVDKDYDLRMVDFGINGPGKYFVQGEYETILASEPSGSFGDIMLKYINKYYNSNIQEYENGAKNLEFIKDVVVCCGDNVFGAKSEDMLEFFTEAINDKSVHVALMGARRKPEIAAERFGVIAIDANPINDRNIYNVVGFSEKPKLAVIKAENSNLKTKDGDCVANTGMFYMSKDVMKHLVQDAINTINSKGKKALKNRESNPLYKNDNEYFDFANAVKYAQEHMSEWGIGVNEKNKGTIVKVVDKWEDVGEPKAYMSFLKEIKDNGAFIENFPENQKKAIKEAIGNKVKFPSGEDNEYDILFSSSVNTLDEAKKDSRFMKFALKENDGTIFNIYKDPNEFPQVKTAEKSDINNISKTLSEVKQDLGLIQSTVDKLPKTIPTPTSISTNPNAATKNDVNTISDSINNSLKSSIQGINSKLDNMTNEIRNNINSISNKNAQNIEPQVITETKVEYKMPENYVAQVKDLSTKDKWLYGSLLPIGGAAVGVGGTLGVTAAINHYNSNVEPKIEEQKPLEIQEN